MQEELDGVTGRARLPTPSDRVNTPYTEAVIHEIQRMGNIVDLGVAHYAREDCRLGKNKEYFIPKDTLVIYFFYIIDL